MAVESSRGCGHRKVGALYLVGSGSGMPCCKLPIPLTPCPTCGGGIKQTRAFTWIDPRPWFKGECFGQPAHCPAADPERLGARCGLIWVGEKFYPTTEAFNKEADEQGISRRIAAVPKGFEIGKTWVLLAHPKAVYEDTGMKPGVFRIFRPQAIEKIVTASQARDDEAVARLRQQGIRPVIVPDDDPDHQGSVYDEIDDESDATVLANATQAGEGRT
jgi:hypothetical protein